MNFIQYVKQVWKAKPIGGTPFSPDRLNHMEDGIKNNNNMISFLNSNMTINLLNPTLHTTTQNGITCTNNADGTYTINGTATDLFAINLMEVNFTKIKENVKLCGCSSGGSNTTYKLSLIIADTSVQQNDYGDGAIINNPNILASNKVALRIVVYKGITLKGAIFKPMLTTNLNATYNDFVSYTGNTGRLNADVALLKNNLDNNIIETLDNHSIGSGASINMDSKLFSSHKPLYIHAIAAQNPSSITGMPQDAYGYGVLITLLSKYESAWGTCQIYIPHAGEVSRDIYVRTMGDTYKRKPSWRHITSTQIGAT